MPKLGVGNLTPPDKEEQASTPESGLQAAAACSVRSSLAAIFLWTCEVVKYQKGNLFKNGSRGCLGDA